MNIRTLITAAYAFLSFSIADTASAHDGEAETVTKNLKAAIPNPPDKSLIAVGVDYASGMASPFHTYVESAFIYDYMTSVAIKSKVKDGEVRIYRAARVGPNRRTRTIQSTETRAKPSWQSYLPLSPLTLMTIR